MGASETHNRLQLLRSHAKALCAEHGLQPVIDFFLNTIEGNVIKLECGCRRKEFREAK